MIVASKRARRPHDVVPVGAAREAATSAPETCPFCPGNEEHTPPPIRVVTAGDRTGSETAAALNTDRARDAAPQTPRAHPPWLLRVCPNRFPALEAADDQATAGASIAPFFERAPASGLHEVIIETPEHDADLCRLEPDALERVVAAYAERDGDLRTRDGIGHVIIFRNHGRAAGASLEHPHSQVAAMPEVPPAMVLRFETARRYFDETGRSLYADLVERELAAGERIVERDGGLVVLAPFASRLPFETWIVPETPSAGALSAERNAVLAALARLLGRTLARIDQAAGDPPYNLVVCAAPVGAEHAPWFSWHVQIVPRITTPAGFELGTGTSIN
ncbi:MAG: hypothetical protein D6760_12795, partial [Deltaproteobacteria bacterium]